jgi:hypothetical protein
MIFMDNVFNNKAELVQRYSRDNGQIGSSSNDSELHSGDPGYNFGRDTDYPEWGLFGGLLLPAKQFPW